MYTYTFPFLIPRILNVTFVCSQYRWQKEKQTNKKKKSQSLENSIKKTCSNTVFSCKQVESISDARRDIWDIWQGTCLFCFCTTGASRLVMEFYIFTTLNSTEKEFNRSTNLNPSLPLPNKYSSIVFKIGNTLEAKFFKSC